MRMWKVPPATMCGQHLCGEHVEMHMFAGSLRRGISVAGYVRKGLVELDHIVERHDALAEEMVRRGYEHASPMSQADVRPCDEGYGDGYVIEQASRRELHRRCVECRERWQQYKEGAS